MKNRTEFYNDNDTNNDDDNNNSLICIIYNVILCNVICV